MIDLPRLVRLDHGTLAVGGVYELLESRRYLVNERGRVGRVDDPLSLAPLHVHVETVDTEPVCAGLGPVDPEEPLHV